MTFNQKILVILFLLIPYLKGITQDVTPLRSGLDFKEPRTFSTASLLDIGPVVGNIKFQTHDKENLVVIQLEGHDDDLKTITVSPSFGQVTLRMKDPVAHHNRQPLTMTITMPSAMPLIAHIISGHLNIPFARINTKTTLSILGHASIETSLLTGQTYLIIQGMGDAVMQSVKGTLNISVTGNSRVQVADGSLDQLKVSMTGFNHFLYEGKALNADLTLQGDGEIQMKDVQNIIRKKCLGIGTIHIRNTNP